MHTTTIAAVFAALTISALAQQAPGTASTPCPSDTAKAKAKKILGGILRGTPIGQTAAPASGCPASPPAQPAPQPDAAKPATAQQAAGAASAPPSPANVAEVTGGNYFTPNTQGVIPFEGGGGVSWIWGDPEYEQKPRVILQPPRGSPVNVSYAGHSGADYYIVNNAGGNPVINGRQSTGPDLFRLTVSNGRATVTNLGQVDPPPGLSGLIANNEPPPPPGAGATGGYTPLTPIDDNTAMLDVKGNQVMVTHQKGDPESVWRSSDDPNHRYKVDGRKVTDLGAKAGK